MVSDEYVSDELIATMNWLTRHERHARRLTPLKLFITLRGVATKNGGGSARHAQSDELHGFSNVVAGDRVRFVDCDISELELLPSARSISGPPSSSASRSTMSSR